MPFQSEKQRRYLWANEPEIARDWADTYGSRIKKDDGGIMNPRLVPHTGADLLVKNTATGERPKYQPPGGGMGHVGRSEAEGGEFGDSYGPGRRGSHHPGVGATKPPVTITPDRDDRPEQTIKAQKKAVKDRKAAQKQAVKDKKAEAKALKLQQKKKSALVNYLRKTGQINPHMDPEEIADMLQSQFKVTTNADGTKSYSFTGDAIDTGFQKGTKYTMPTDTQLGPFGLKDTNVKGEKLSTKYIDRTPDFSTKMTMPVGLQALGFGKPNFNTLLSTFNRMNTLGNIKTQEDWQGYWDDVRARQVTPDRDGPQNPCDGPNPPAYCSAGTGGGTTPPVDEGSTFQDSLTGTADTPNYYVGSNPLASNIAWGKQAGVDPRTMGIYNQDQLGFPTWAAEGGRIPAAFGGIMDSSTGRRAYGLGSIFKKIGRAAKKVLKSPIGKIGIGALAMGMPWAGGAPALTGKWFGGASGWGKMAPFLRGAVQKGVPGKSESGWLRNLFSTDGKLNPWKMGIGAASMLPFFMGGGDDDDDDKFDYEGAKNKYRDEMMNIKRGVMAGSLNPNQWSYLPSNYTYTGAEGGRARLSNGGDPFLREEYNKYVFEMKEMGITPMTFEEFAAQARAGMYAGGQSTPSDYTMEDAMMTTTQDKLGGITDVMKQADLYRQGDVGQFYAADGGRIGYAGGGAGNPPITMGQAPQVPPQMPRPQAPPTPMPAPQPNQVGRGMPGGMNPMGRGMPGGMNPMGRGMPGGMNPMMGRPMMRGMNPMMNRPMMRGMPGRRIGYADGTLCVPKKAYPWPKEHREIAQEGGLMDLGGMEKDYRQEGGFVPLGGKEKADDVPARLSKNEFVFTADAVRGAGDGDIDKGAEVMENIMKNLEQGGQISEETQGLSGAQEMFGVSERLSEVV